MSTEAKSVKERNDELDKEFVEWAVSMGLPWKVACCGDIHDRTDNWIGDFSDPEVARQVVSLMNEAQGVFNQMGELLK